MTEKIIAFFSGLPRELYVFVISILPIIELRGAIPVGAAIGLPFYVNYPVAVLGNLLPVPFILAFIPWILEFMHKHRILRGLVEWVWAKAEKYKGKIIVNAECRMQKAECEQDDYVSRVEMQDDKKSRERLSGPVFLALMLFVAIPLPGTGAWTGSLVASLFGLPKKSSFIAVAFGVLISGIIMSLASYGVLGFLKFLL
jgi:uncharacterized membrane protein